MFAIIVYGLKRKLLRPMVITNVILLPLLLILILGNALSSTFADAETGESAVSQQEVTLTVVDDDHSDTSRNLVAMLSAEASPFDVSTAKSLDAGKADLESRDQQVLLRIVPGFEARQVAEKAGSVELFAIDDNVDALRASQVALDAYSDISRAQTTVATLDGSIQKAYVPSDFLQTKSDGDEAAADPSAGVTGITYYAVTMLVLILIYGIANTMNFVTEEYVGPLGDRYLSSPVDKVALVGSQVLAGVVLTLIQALVIVLVARFAFGADYGGSLPAFFTLVIVAAVFFNAIGLFLGMLARRWPTLDVLVTIAIPAMTFIGGGFVKLDLNGLQNLSLNTLFQRAMFEQISGVGVNWSPLYGCLAVAAAGLLASVILLKRPEGR